MPQKELVMENPAEYIEDALESAIDVGEKQAERLRLRAIVEYVYLIAARASDLATDDYAAKLQQAIDDYHKEQGELYALRALREKLRADPHQFDEELDALLKKLWVD